MFSQTLMDTLMPSTDNTDKRVPVTVFTGFLGSGKSSYINHLLSTAPHIRFGIVVNEFGAVPLESEIVRAQAGDIMELSNGCMCCVARNDLLRAVKRLVRADRKLDHILVEASGLSDPVPVAQTFLQGPGRKHFELGPLVCLVDGTQFEEHAREFDVVSTQLAFSDYVLVNRHEHLRPEAVSRLESVLSQAAPEARVLYAGGDTAGDIELSILGADPRDSADPAGDRGSGDRAMLRVPERNEGHHHDAVVISEYTTDRRIDSQRLGEVLKSLPPGIVRGKGVLHFAGRRYRRYRFILQHTVGRTTFDARRKKRNDSSQSHLLFIGRGFDTDELRERVAACTVHD
ncbi:MAG: GTP-binding protein [Spirochaetaceae bacterium]|nr:MAG: GTP-binding protein [Spirochaetaceae bacterium]